jgi:hypothetical protein
MRISLYHVASALIAASIVLSSIAPASAAPIRMMGFGPGHVAHFQSPGFRPNVDHRFFAGDRFHRGHGGLLGADIGLYAPFLGDVGPDYGSFAAPGVVNSNVSRVTSFSVAAAERPWRTIAICTAIACFTSSSIARTVAISAKRPAGLATETLALGAGPQAGAGFVHFRIG